jgi:hypothetical protein
MNNIYTTTLPIIEGYTSSSLGYIGCCFFEKCSQKTGKYPDVYAILYRNKKLGCFIEYIKAEYNNEVVYFELKKYNNSGELSRNYSDEDKEFVRNKTLDYFKITFDNH